ncbi:hypothetical protein BDZ45DRAFT_67069 [Acephala macrosclerotiorum]|nr:hypothetical protein BDZ45DRAFT_67069 [Acephala macrosclerotiorum]
MVPMRLLKANLADFQISILTDGLSRTFSDAIYATRKLGVQYLWIDSLCIVQDSAEDWQKESAVMGQVYASGLCNLAATAATEGSQGLFLNKLPTPQALIDIDGSRDFWHLNENPGHHWGDILNFAPLNWRGWVFQERFLSTRVIHFGRSRVYWECGQKKCCNWPGKSIERELGSNSWTNQSKSYWQNVLNGTRTVGKDEAAQLWTSIVDHYSSHSAFTFVTDKLLAIGGLASRVQRSTRCRYVAGVWEHNLLPQLMWDMANGTVNTPQTSDYVAPSWSWASVHEPISRYRVGKGPNYTPSPVVEARDIDIQLVTDNEFGQIKGGSITLIGRLGFVQDMDGFEVGGNGELRFAGLQVVMDRRGDASEDQNRHRYLLVVEEQRVDETISGGGLVLKSVEEVDGFGAASVFKRAGFFQYWFGKGTKDAIEELQGAFDKTTLAEQLPQAQKRSGKSQYVCKIV